MGHRPHRGGGGAPGSRGQRADRPAGPGFRREFTERFGRSDAARALLEQILQLAETDDHVLIVGEAGTQKVLLARAIHDASPRAKRGFGFMDCSVLGGKGGDAVEEFIASLRSAQGGSLFVNYIEQLPSLAQAALCEVIETGRTTALKGAPPIEWNVRILAGTTLDPERLSTGRDFDARLHEYLSRRVILIPPLRDRPEDILSVADHFRRAACVELRKSVRTFDPQTRHVLLEHSWPGNYAELWHVIHQAIAKAPGEALRAETIRAELPHRRATVEAGSADAMIRHIIRAQSRALERSLAGEQERPFRLPKTSLIRRLLDLARWRRADEGAKGQQAETRRTRE